MYVQRAFASVFRWFWRGDDSPPKPISWCWPLTCEFRSWSKKRNTKTLEMYFQNIQNLKILIFSFQFFTFFLSKSPSSVETFLFLGPEFDRSRASFDRGVSIGSVVDFSDDFESKMRNSIRDELAVVMDRLLSEREVTPTFTPSVSGIEHKIAHSASVAHSAFTKHIDKRLDSFQRQLSEMMIRVQTTEDESRTFASNSWC